MTSFLKDGDFPSVKFPGDNDITTEERSSAIEFVNRHNFLCEEFDIAKILRTFLPDAAIYHSKGSTRGHIENKFFLENHYGPIIPGIFRLAINHVVDRDGDDGVVVRYQQIMLRHSFGEVGIRLPGSADIRSDGLPAVWLASSMVDRLRRTDEGWKIYERYLGPLARNKDLDPRIPSKV